MSNFVNINNDILTWAIARAGFDVSQFTEQHTQVKKWLQGEKNPTIKQLENFSRKLYLPFGYLFLKEPPEEILPIPFFRNNNDQVDKVSINVYDTILILQQRQDWLKNYLLENDFETLPFVGSFKDTFGVIPIVNDIRKVLNLEENWASEFKKWEDTLNHLVEKIEDKGIITVFNGVVGNNPHRNIPVSECRGFVLVDEIVPFMFINNSDSKSAQIFTIVHELAHIWIGHSVGFDFRELQPADDPIEKLCDKIAAEFLVPTMTFNKVWEEYKDTKDVAKYFKVSEIVIARRALDTKKWSKEDFFRFYNEYKDREFTNRKKQGSGGNFYATVKKRLSITFASHVNQAVKTGQLLYRDAYKLTNMKGDTFDTFFSQHV